MNAQNLSRQLSTSVVDALKAHGHILVVKGGAAALARELDELMAPTIAVVGPQVEPRGLLAQEPTSTFGDEHIDQVVEDMVGQLTRALMSSDHVEDVFAEDAVIRRDIFRTVQAGLLAPAIEGGGMRGTLMVKLDTLGYVAATVSKRSDAGTLRLAFDRAASAANARFSAYSPTEREATFQIERGGPDERLDLEEAVADELADLAEQGLVQLPTVERRVDLPRALSPAEQRALAPRIDALADATLLRSGCAAVWDFADAQTIRVIFTPLSDQDALGVDAPMTVFARQVAELLPADKGRATAEPEAAANAAPAAAEEAPPTTKRKGAPRAKERAPTSATPAEPGPRPAKRTAKRAAAEPEAPAPPAAKRKSAAAKTAAARAAKKTAKKG